MFTGLISGIGRVVDRDGGVFTVRSGYPAASIAIGASIAHDGCCLTVVDVRADGVGSVWRVEVSNETLAKTTLGAWQKDRAVNLERALKAGDEIGGHLVAGHVDGVAEIVDVRADGDSRRFTLAAPGDLARYIAPKGSVALDGTSLTVNEVVGRRFGVNIIPHTLAVTTWGGRQAGDTVNFEADVLARHVARLMDAREAGAGPDLCV